jgi:hypothetical protein
MALSILSRASLLSFALAAGACSPSNPSTDASADVTTPPSDVTTPPADVTTPPADVTTPPADVTTPPSDGGGSLYERLGRRAGIAGAVDAIVARELMDPEIASYFYFQVTPGRGGMPPVDGHPSVAQLKSCLVNQLANVAGGPEQYPGTPADNMGWQCRNMRAAHADLNIPNSVFDRFVSIAAGVLMGAGVAPADIATIGGVLNSTRADVAQGTSRDGGAFVPPTDASAPRDGG